MPFQRPWRDWGNGILGNCVAECAKDAVLLVVYLVVYWFYHVDSLHKELLQNIFPSSPMSHWSNTLLLVQSKGISCRNSEIILRTSTAFHSKEHHHMKTCLRSGTSTTLSCPFSSTLISNGPLTSTALKLHVDRLSNPATLTPACLSSSNTSSTSHSLSRLLWPNFPSSLRASSSAVQV